MSADAWQDANNRYLAAALNWLRLRLERLARKREPALSPLPSPPSEPPPGEGAVKRWLARGHSQRPVPLLPAGDPPSLEELIAEARREREAAARAEPAPALVFLARQFNLSDFERDILLLCAAMELDPDLGGLCARAQGQTSRAFPTFGLALSLFDQPAWDALSAQRPLRYARLIEVNQPHATPLTASALRAEERIANYIKGLNLMDDRLTTLLGAGLSGGVAWLAASQQRVVEAVLERLRQAAEAAFLPVVQLVGADPGCKQAVAGGVATALNRQLYRLSLEALPTPIAEVETLARLWQRESMLSPVALFLDADGADHASAESVAACHRLLGREIGLVFVGVRETPLNLGTPTVLFEAAKPTPAEQRDAWLAELGRGESPARAETDRAARQLAGQFNLNLGEIRRLAAAGRAGSDKGVAESAGPVWMACRDWTRPRLDVLAQRLDAKATWDDLVLPPDSSGLLRQIADQVRERNTVYEDWGFARKMNRGLGISALFTGESGTGKTMAAEVIANELGLNLYRIDLSAVVSKYIGETEKNLRKLFDAAEAGGAILFFDEADALFGKRSEVKDSHDRYANIEINYLLQRMEAFRGLAILATNMKSALDPAFMRRLRFVVTFAFPGVAERTRIWERALPPDAPREALDYGRLARLNLTGGNIHSIALNAAFLAARDGQVVTMPLLLQAVRQELRKLEKPISEAELR